MIIYIFLVFLIIVNTKRMRKLNEENRKFDEDWELISSP